MSESASAPRQPASDDTASASSDVGAVPQASADEVALADIIARLRRAMRRAARAGDPDTDLSVAQLELLSCLAENPGARPSELARLLRLAPNSVTTLVNGLHSRDLVARADGGTDRRTVSLRVTPAGQQAVLHWHATNTAILRGALTDLHPAWRHLLTAALPALQELVHAIDTLDGGRP